VVEDFENRISHPLDGEVGECLAFPEEMLMR
jgi:hypothetical protein